MANVDNPHGFRPLARNLSGGFPWVEEFDKVVGYGTALFIHDAVNQVAAGGIEKSITPGTTLISGVNLNYGAVSTATKHLVITSPDAIFEAQDDQASTGLVEADRGLNSNIVMGAGSAVTLLSGNEIGGATKDVTATLDVHLLKLFESPDNAYGVHARFEIVFNKHRMIANTVGI